MYVCVCAYVYVYVNMSMCVQMCVHADVHPFRCAAVNLYTDTADQDIHLGIQILSYTLTLLIKTSI